MAAQWFLSASGGQALWALSDAAPVAPNAPSGLTASGSGGTTASLDLTDTNSGASGYRWQIAPVSTGVYVDAAGDANPTAAGVHAFTATGLSPATQYQPRARAEVSGLFSSYVDGPTFWTDNTGTGGGEVPLALSGGSQADITVAASGAGVGSGDAYSGGSSASVEISAAGGGSGGDAGEAYSGGSSASVQVSAAGWGLPSVLGPGVAHPVSDFKIISGKPTIDKDPDSTLDYEALSLTKWLTSMQDSISVETPPAVVASSGVEVLNCSASGSSVILWVTGGKEGAVGSVTIRVRTTAGRVNDYTVYFNIRQN